VRTNAEWKGSNNRFGADLWIETVYITSPYEFHMGPRPTHGNEEPVAAVH
jgi:hypothetical protein